MSARRRLFGSSLGHFLAIACALGLSACATGTAPETSILPARSASSAVAERASRQPVIKPVYRVQHEMGGDIDPSAALNLAAIADWRSGQRERALDGWRQAVQQAPRDAALHNNLGYALLTLGELEEAWLSLRSAFMLDPTNARTRANLQAFSRAWRERCAAEARCRGRMPPTAASSDSPSHVHRLPDPDRHAD